MAAIRVEELGKRYRLAQGGQRGKYRTLRESLAETVGGAFRRSRGGVAERAAPEEFWALKDVGFEVKPGEVVGIIGRNGAGKSTLLKILSRITKPTTGRVEINGRVGSLLEVGTGFHPELSGRENIYLNGSILGMSRKEIDRKFDEIVAFAEVEKFLDLPVKRYSSGMYVRLAFAVAAHLEPEILIVDEVLAVGDAQFQKKCMGKMAEVSRCGRTVLFVSHNMAAIQNLCSRGVLLEGGRVKTVGKAADVARSYLNFGAGPNGTFNTTGRRLTPSIVQIIDAWIEKEGTRTDTLLFGDRVNVVLELQVREKLRFAVELLLRQQDGLPVAFAPSGLGSGWEISPPPGRVRVRCSLPPVRYASGQYSIDLLTAISGHQILDYIESGLSFVVDSAALGAGNWPFRQSGGQGFLAWDVAFQVDDTYSGAGGPHAAR